MFFYNWFLSCQKNIGNGQPQVSNFFEEFIKIYNENCLRVIFVPVKMWQKKRGCLICGIQLVIFCFFISAVLLSNSSSCHSAGLFTSVILLKIYLSWLIFESVKSIAKAVLISFYIEIEAVFGYIKINTAVTAKEIYKYIWYVFAESLKSLYSNHFYTFSELSK